MKGYKGMNADMTCRGMQFEVGKPYHIDGDIKLCESGFHFCEKLHDAFGFYDKYDSRFFEVEASGDIVSGGNKSATSDIIILRELSRIEINRCIYGYGDGYGYGNGDGNGNGNGYGYGNGNGYGYGDGYGNGNGYGYGDGYGNGNGYGDNIQKIAIFR